MMYENQSDTGYDDGGIRLETIAVHSEPGDDQTTDRQTETVLPTTSPSGYVNKIARSHDSGFIDTDYATDGHNQYIKPDSGLRLHALVPIKEPDDNAPEMAHNKTYGRSRSKLRDTYAMPRYVDEPFPPSDIAAGMIGNQLRKEAGVEVENCENYDRLKESEYDKITSYHRNTNVNTTTDDISDDMKQKHERSNARTYTNMDFMRVGDNALESVPHSKIGMCLRDDGYNMSNSSFTASLLSKPDRHVAGAPGCGMLFAVVTVAFITGVVTGAAGPVSFIIMDRSRPCECNCVGQVAGTQDYVPASTLPASTTVGTPVTADPATTRPSDARVAGDLSLVPTSTTVSNNDSTTPGVNTTNSTTVTESTSSSLTTPGTSSTVPTTTKTSSTASTTTTEPIQTGGAVYTRWGRTVCPGDGVDTIYKGYAAGGDSSQTGGVTKTVCLPEVPTWNKYSSTADDDRAFLYGSEYGSEDNFNTPFLGSDVQHEDVPCVVCQARSRHAHMLVPGRTGCYMDWNLEYSGYLMAGNHGSEMICVDVQPEFRAGGSANEGGNLLYFVEVRSGSLPTPPYNDRLELACAVCTQ